jgi:hypothetical protein
MCLVSCQLYLQLHYRHLRHSCCKANRVTSDQCISNSMYKRMHSLPDNIFRTLSCSAGGVFCDSGPISKYECLLPGLDTPVCYPCKEPAVCLFTLFLDKSFTLKMETVSSKYP